MRGMQSRLVGIARGLGMSPRFNLPLLPQEKGARGMRYLSLAAPDMRTQRVKLAIAESLFSWDIRLDRACQVIINCL